MSEWFNYTAALKILIFGLLIGAGLPALFAVGVRMQRRRRRGSRPRRSRARQELRVGRAQLGDLRAGVGRGDHRRAVRRTGLHRPSDRRCTSSAPSRSSIAQDDVRSFIGRIVALDLPRAIPKGCPAPTGSRCSRCSSGGSPTTSQDRRQCVDPAGRVRQRRHRRARSPKSPTTLPTPDDIERVRERLGRQGLAARRRRATPRTRG